MAVRDEAGRGGSALQNARHEGFAQGVAKGMTADEAYAAAGYKPNRGNAARLKANDSIAARIEALVSSGAERAEIDIARTLKELVRIGTSDVRRLFTESGGLRSIGDLDDDTAAAIAAVEVVTKRIPASGDEPPEIEYVHKVKFWDKNSALEKIGKHLGMFVERHELTGRDGGPIETRDVTADADAFTGRFSRLAAARAAGPGDGEPDTGDSGSP